MPPVFDAWRSGAVALDVALATRASAAELGRRRDTRLAALLDAALRDSPFYRERMAARRGGAPVLADFPALSKDTLMRHFDAWCTDPQVHLRDVQAFVRDSANIAQPFLGRYAVWESSGSSGVPAIFLQDAQALAVNDALEGLRRPARALWSTLLDPWQLGERMVFVGATGGHFASTVAVERLRRLNPLHARALATVSLMQPLGAIVDALNRLVPTVIATYPSVALILARERADGRLRAAPHALWTGGENMSCGERRVIEAGMGCPVVASYGASEFLALACECAHGSLHLNSDWAVLEPVDARGLPVAPGGACATTLLTNLANHAQPLIRYDIGDRVSFSAVACRCGSSLPVIAVDGRCDDTLHLGAGPGPRISVVALALSTVLEDEAGLFDFQLRQTGPCELLLATPRSGPDQTRLLRRARDALQAFLADLGAPPIVIHCRSAEPALRGRSGKTPRVMAQV